MNVPARENLQKKNRKKAERTPKTPSHARPKAVLIKPAEGMSYASILRKLKKRVNPDELGATVQGIRETRSKDLLVELKFSQKDREPAKGIPGATSAPQERKSPGSIMSRDRCATRLSGRQPPRGGPEKLPGKS